LRNSRNVIKNVVKGFLSRNTPNLDEKSKSIISTKLAVMLITDASAEQSRNPNAGTILELVKDSLNKISRGICIHAEKQDGYILFKQEFNKINIKPANMCEACVSPRVCKLRSALLNQRELAGMYLKPDFSNV